MIPDLTLCESRIYMRSTCEKGEFVLHWRFSGVQRGFWQQNCCEPVSGLRGLLPVHVELTRFAGVTMQALVAAGHPRDCKSQAGTSADPRLLPLGFDGVQACAGLDRQVVREVIARQKFRTPS